MFSLLARSLSVRLQDDHIGGVGTSSPTPTPTRVPLPQQAQLQATTTAITDFFNQQQSGTPSTEARQTAVHDLFQLSANDHLTDGELNTVMDMQRNIQSGHPISQGDVSQVTSIVNRLQSQLQGTGNTQTPNPNPSPPVQGSTQPPVSVSQQHFQQADTEFRAHHFQNAESQFRQALATAPSDNPSIARDLHYDLGRTLERQGRNTEAVQEYRQFLQTAPQGDPETIRTQHHMEQLEHSLRPPSERQSQQHFRQADADYRAGRYQNAESQFRQALATAPPNRPDITGAMHYNLGQTLAHEGRPAEAAQEYQNYLQANPHAQDADEIHTRISELQSQAHFQSGNTHFSNHDYHGAETEWRQALDLAPPGHSQVRADLHFDLGRALEEQGRNSEAIHEYEQFLQVHPNLGDPDGNNARERIQHLGGTPPPAIVPDPPPHLPPGSALV